MTFAVSSNCTTSTGSHFHYSFHHPYLTSWHDSDGYWSREEIEAIYGVHHIYSQKKSKDDEEHQKKADHITSKVLGILDRDNDGMVSAKEFQKAGMDALPNFDDLGAEGHHYDVESGMLCPPHLSISCRSCSNV